MTTTRRGFIGRLSGMLALAAAAPATLLRARTEAPPPPSAAPDAGLVAWEEEGGPLLRTRATTSHGFVTITASTDMTALEVKHGHEGEWVRYHHNRHVALIERPRFGEPPKQIFIRAHDDEGVTREDGHTIAAREPAGRLGRMCLEGACGEGCVSGSVDINILAQAHHTALRAIL